MKKGVEDLAILGGSPAFAEALHVNRPNIGDRRRFIDRVNDILDNRWFTNNGHFVQTFERQIAERLQVKHCIVVCNATIGLEIVIRALALQGEVIIPSFTFIATAHALQWMGITPIFADIEPETHNINPKQVERMITSRTTGIMGVHLWGRACRVEALLEVAQQHHLKVLFDAAHAFECSYKGCMIGNFGNAEVFSFHATKFFNTFEGGAITTNDDELAQKIRVMKNFGFAGDVVSVGTNGKMTEIAAAMGLTGLENMQDFIVSNHRNYKYYHEALKDIPGISLITYDETERCNYQYIVVEIDETLTHVSRDQLLNILWAENVLARRYFYPGCHRMEPYRSNFPHAGVVLPETEALSQRVLVLPTGTTIDTNEIVTICQILRLAITHNREIQGILAQVPNRLHHHREGSYGEYRVTA